MDRPLDDLHADETPRPETPPQVETIGPLPSVEDEIIIRRGFFTELVSFSIDNPFIVLIAVALIVVAGLLCLRNLRLDALPDLSDNQVVILADWMGRSPEV